MKQIAVVLFLLIAMVVCACQGASQHITGADFQAEYEKRHQQSMHFTEFIGEREGRVFLRNKTMSTLNTKKWSEVVLYTEASDLDSEFLRRLRKESKN
ncbi:hypothetical protein [Trichloromonas acetexigens]|jgi:hypothetical protein|uniref:Uncharacterized protein n=1 Tax=Trichloromonas acetexigens TaxID=38815 RepID=A0A550JFK8_9BACT|nr:hypothetical protein [Desulfuromonas acetexigens]TRO81990.1 hypothetical protein FL622_09345 [Desulfuromonas acetexigens]